MLAKAVCLVAALVSSSLCFNPPPSSKTVDPKKEQRVVSEVRFLTEYANKFPFVFISIAVLETALYLVLMTNNGTSGGGSGAASGILKGSSSLPLHDQVIFQEMAVLKTWQLIATVLCLLGYALRKWSFITLDRFFTYQLTIRTGHKLVQSGPYTYLRHPSYTGAILNGICFRFLLFHQGLWNVFTLLASRAASAVLQTKVAVPTTVLGFETEYWMMLTYGLMMVYGIAYRVRNEEAMLKNHFGREWDVYASKRWRFIPFVY
ncbi:hypothetical protein K457DRAFT_151829 [Linnemannia elongata AG-77]|uniref:Protein-S-isoprenylcysteine O-methyltransferase n=1 Tax=Linnemannia elongata AG-77 TaxID=1314771 RepID=A0A197KFZ0_9FUNG|nr:hypothetical protein K457DRAFT_151829 [Linnemannia elongata AG-77]